MAEQQGAKAKAREFVKRWTARGDEKQDAQNYWRDLLVNVLGVPSAMLANFISFERKVQGGYIDAFIEDTGVLIEQKSLGVDLSKAQKQSDGTELTPYGQAVRYGAKLPFSLRPRWIITSNFDTILIYDQESDPAGKEPYEIRLVDLPDELYRLSFIADKANSRIERERDLSVKAGEVVGKLYASLSSQYLNIQTDPNEQRSLNVLIVRLVFLLYAEDAGLLQHHGALYDYLKPIPVPQMRQAIIDLFRVLDTPDGSGGTEDERDPYLAPELLAFPYINGGLFSDEGIVVPQFTDQIKLDLLVEASSKFDWSDVSPTIFGAVFESTLNPETRRAGGMHYTSIENIHKVIDPLFLDDLRRELESIEALKTDRDRKIRLKAFQKKLGSINILDPACGSGNFLTESYLSLRRLENRVIEGLVGEQLGIGFEGEANPIQVKLSQFYGIEINDFAVSVAKTALWIAESQMIEATQEIVLQVLDFLPLKSNSNIVEGNALRMDWNEVLPAKRCSYIVGNPPFLGGMQMNKIQKEEMRDVFPDAIRNTGELDYVTAWYVKAAEYAMGTDIECALVSTNSITQGLSVGTFWRLMNEHYGFEIDFGYRTFIWDSEASDKAHVHVVIIGFSEKGKKPQKRIFENDGSSRIVNNINGYLMDAMDVYVNEVSSPLSEVPPIRFGSMPRTKGFTLTSEERKEFLRADPQVDQWIRPYWGADEFLNRKERFCLWLVDVDPADIEGHPLVEERVRQVKEERSASKAAGTRKFAETPTLFAQIAQPAGPGKYLLIPRVSSERRKYIPIAFVNNHVIASDLAYLMPSAELYHFGVMSSQFHNAWVRTVAGRMKSDYRYAKDLVYNTFVWPDANASSKAAIEEQARRILEIRDSYPSQKIGDLYKDDRMPDDLRQAHKALDQAVEEAYGVDFDGDEERIIAHLFSLYTKEAEDK